LIALAPMDPYFRSARDRRESANSQSPSFLDEKSIAHDDRKLERIAVVKYGQDETHLESTSRGLQHQ